MVLEALRHGKQDEDRPLRSSGLDQAELAIATSISLLEYHSKIIETASLYLKVSRSLNRLLERVLGTSGARLKCSPRPGLGDKLPHQMETLQYGWPEQHPGPPEDTASDTFSYPMFDGDHQEAFHGTSTPEYAHNQYGAAPYWQVSEFDMCDSIDPSLLSYQPPGRPSTR